MYDVSDLARKYAPWSHSKVELADTCPAQFNHKHLAKTPSSAAPSDTKVGIAAHAILEHRIQGTAYAPAHKTALESTPLTSAELEMLHMLQENIDNFLRRFDAFCKAQHVTKVLTEVDWGFTEMYQKTGFFDKNVYFRGKLDLGALTRDNDLFLIDHKSGVAKALEQDTHKRQQLQSYAVLALSNLPDIAGIRGGINFLQGEPELLLQWTPYNTASRIRELYAPWLFRRINEAATNLVEPFEARPAKGRMKKNNQPGWPCGWCQYQQQCPTFQEKFGGS